MPNKLSLCVPLDVAREVRCNMIHISIPRKRQQPAQIRKYFCLFVLFYGEGWGGDGGGGGVGEGMEGGITGGNVMSILPLFSAVVP